MDSYSRGLQQRDRGNWQRALQIWSAARDSLDEQNRSEPRIGIAYIELATEKQASEYYRDATAMYFWGFSQYDSSPFSNVIKKEIDRLSPLLDQKTASGWFKLLESKDPILGHKIREFWVRKDPIPTSEVNERLIEHWERIAYARKKFTYEKGTKYSSDDRGLVLVKYGSPDETFSGKLGTDQMEIMRLFDDFSLRQEIQRYNTLPEFEIWLYRGLASKESSIFLFGKRSGFAMYGLRDGLEDFIPERAFSRSSTQTTRGVLPGAVLQFMYYSELMRIDKFYLNRYRELESLWANARAGGRLAPDYDFFKGKLSSYRSMDKDRAKFKFLVRDKTDALEGLEPLQIKYKLFRYLDERRQPKAYLAAVSTSRDYDDLDFTPYFRQAKKSKFKQRYVLIGYNSEWGLQRRLIDFPALKNGNTAVFDLAYEDSISNYALVAEKTLLGSRKAEIQQSDIPDTAKVIGIGSVFLGEIPPLDNDSTKFEVSDIIIGVEYPPEFESLKYPFPILIKDPVRRSDDARVYVELYQAGAEGIFPFTARLQYRIDAIDKKGKLKKVGERKIDFQVNRVNFEKIVPLKLDGLSAGDYQIAVEVIQKSSRQKKSRVSKFRIMN
ncbi:MAG: GWxTD domain-containing protein [bacterium]